MHKTLFAISLASCFLVWGEDADAICNEAPCVQSVCCGICCEPQPNQCLDTCGYNPPYYDMNCDWGISIGADFLYWYGREQDLEIGTIQQQVQVQPTLKLIDSALTTVPIEILYLDAAWDPGVRVSLGFNMPCDHWDLLLQWTHYKNTEKTKKAMSPIPGREGGTVGQLSLITPWTIPQASFGANSDNYFDLLMSKWRVRYNDLQLQLGRRYWVSSCFTLRPFVGLRGCWTDVRFDLRASRALFPVPPETFPDGLSVSSKTQFDNDFWGAGFSGGFEPRFYFSPCFSLFGGFEVSLLWGRFEMDRSSFYESIFFVGNLANPPNVFDFKTKGKKHEMQAIVDVEIGLRYEMAFCDRRFLAFLEAGWEHHTLLNHISRLRIFDLPATGSLERDLSFGGFVLRGGFQF